MTTFITVVHIVACIFLIIVVLIQSGKGAEISTSLGGSSQTVFGSSGGANFFTRFTAIMAATFLTTSVILTVINNRANKSVIDATTPVPAAAPAAPSAPAKK